MTLWQQQKQQQQRGHRENNSSSSNIKNPFDLFQVTPSRPSFTDSSALINNNPFLDDIKCPFCQKSFAHKSSMSRHKMMCKFNDNPKSKLYCELCLKTFSQRWMLQKHLTESSECFLIANQKR